MIYLYITLVFLGLSLLIKSFTRDIVEDYLNQTIALRVNGHYSDGCTMPFGLNNVMHKLLKKSFTLCSAHDYGGLGLIVNIRPGWHNNLITWFAHMSQSNPVYWVWGTVIAIFTLPWVVWRRNWGIKIIENATGFYVVQMMIIAITVLILNKPQV